MPAVATCILFGTHAVDEPRLIEQSARHLHSLEAVIQHLIYLIPGNQATHINQRYLQGGTEFQGIFQEISFLKRYARYHPFAYHAYTVFQPPAGHVMRHAADRHFAPHDIHRRLTDEPTAQDQRMCSRLLQPPGHLHRLVQLHPSTETVAHVHLHQHSHITAGSLHHFFHHHIHKTHTVLQRASELVFPMVGGRGQELADEITMPCMNLYRIKSGLPCQIHRTSISTRHLRQLIGTQSAHKGRRVKIETGRCADGHTTANALMGHVATVSQLDACRSPLRMYGISQPTESGDNFRTHPQLAVKRQTALSNCRIGNSSHTYTSRRYRPMIVEQHVRRSVSGTHALESSRTDGTVTQGQRSESDGGE